MAKKKITAKTKIKEVTLTKGKLKVKADFWELSPPSVLISAFFENLEFPRGQEDTLKNWLDGKDEVSVSIELDQAKLPGTE